MDAAQQQQQQQQQTDAGQANPGQPMQATIPGMHWGGGEQPGSTFQQQQHNPGGFVTPYGQSHVGFTMPQMPNQGMMQPPQVPTGLPVPQQAYTAQPFAQQPPGMALQQSFPIQQAAAGFPMPMHQHQLQQGLGMQPYPSFLPQQSMGSFPMFQYPQNVMGFYAGTTPQNWNQVTPTAPLAPSQPAAMEVDDDAS